MTTLLESSKNYTFITIDNASRIKFPLYVLPGEPIVLDGLVFQDGNAVDDRNVNLPTLGERRMHSPQKLGKIKKGYLDIVSFLKDAKTPIVWGLDNNGTIIKYRKTRFERVTCHRIRKTIKKDWYSILLLEGINFPIEVSNPPSDSYAQLLNFKGWPWKLYNTTPIEVPTTRKRV
mgnify:CR=1 FL=1